MLRFCAQSCLLSTRSAVFIRRSRCSVHPRPLLHLPTRLTSPQSTIVITLWRFLKRFLCRSDSQGSEQSFGDQWSNSSHSEGAGEGEGEETDHKAMPRLSGEDEAFLKERPKLEQSLVQPSVKLLRALQSSFPKGKQAETFQLLHKAMQIQEAVR